MSDILDTKMFDSSGTIDPISIPTMPTMPENPLPSDVETSQAVVDTAVTDLQDFTDTFNAPDITIDPETLIATDQDGNIVADFSHLKDQLTELQGMSVPTLNEWMDAEGIEFGTLEDLQSLMGTLITDIGTIDETEQQEALDYAASAFGLGSAEYQELLNQMSTDLTTDGAIQGFSDEQRAAFERSTSRDIANQYEAANKMVNNIMAATGSATRALSAADNYTNNINDYAIKSRTQLIEDDLAAQQSNIQSKQQMWNTLVTTGQMAQGEYLDRMMQSEATALQGYATQMDSILKENAQYLDRFGADLDSIRLSMDVTYTGIMAELGVDQALADQVQTYIENYYTDFNTTAGILETNLAIAEADLANEEAAVDDLFSSILDVGTLVVSVAALFA